MKTHRWILIFLAFQGCSVFGIAQDRPVAPQDMVLSKDYVSNDRRFKIRFPDVPKEFDLPLDTKIGTIVSHSIVHTSNITYWLTYTDYPMTFVKEDAVKSVLDNARNGGLARVAKEDPRILTESDISVDGHPGRFLRVELKGDAILRFKIVLAGNRLYLLNVGTPKGDPKNLEAQESYEKLASSFFDSFKIIPALEADLTAIWKEFSSQDGKYRIQFPGTPYQWSLPLESLREPSTFHVTGYNSAGLYNAMYLDYAETPKDPTALKTFLDDLRDGEIERSEQGGMKLTIVSETDISLDGYPGRFMVAQLKDNAIYRRKTVVVKNRLYVITATTPKDDPKAPAINVYEKLSMRFINSFNLIL